MRRCSAELLKCLQPQFSTQVGNTVVFINSVVLNYSFRSHSSFAKVAGSAYIFDVTFAIETMPCDVSMVVLYIYIYINMNIYMYIFMDGVVREMNVRVLGRGLELLSANGGRF